jgi:DSF synthase
MTSTTQVLDGAVSRMRIAAAPGLESVVELPQRGFAPPLPSKTAAAVAALNLSEFEVEYDAGEKVLWSYFDFSGKPCFTPEVLEQTRQVQRLVRDLATDATGGELPLRYIVMGSRMPGVWNLGGDLEFFAEHIRNRDRAALTRYADLCCDLTFTNATVFDLPVVSIALVQGDAVGGGFEAALSFNLIVAERSAKFAFPEVLFNLFPGMGAYTFLSRRIAPGLAERMMLSGEVYSAEDLYKLGAIDVLAPDGAGIDAVYAHIGRRGRRHACHCAIRTVRRIANPVTREEMIRIADLWIDSALTLTEADLRKITRLAAAQDRRRNRGAAAIRVEVAPPARN